MTKQELKWRLADLIGLKKDMLEELDIVYSQIEHYTAMLNKMNQLEAE